MIKNCFSRFSDRSLVYINNQLCSGIIIPLKLVPLLFDLQLLVSNCWKFCETTWTVVLSNHPQMEWRKPTIQEKAGQGGSNRRLSMLKRWWMHVIASSWGRGWGKYYEHTFPSLLTTTLLLLNLLLMLSMMVSGCCICSSIRLKISILWPQISPPPPPLTFLRGDTDLFLIGDDDRWRSIHVWCFVTRHSV